MYADKDKKSVRTRFICVYLCAICACFVKKQLPLQKVSDSSEQVSCRATL